MKNRLIKKCTAGVVAVLTCMTMVSMVSADVLAGDVNADGSVTAKDLMALKNHILGVKELTAEQIACADMNGDEKINIVDFMYLKRDLVESSETASSSIHLNGDKITAEGDGITVEGTKVTISKSGSYIIDGAMTADAQIIVAAAEDDVEDVELTLNEVSMVSSTDSPCIMIENAEKTKITFNGTNTLTNTFDEATASSAAIYAKDDITFTKKSTGTLEINTNACMSVYCNNDIKFNGGTFSFKTDADGSETVKADAVKAKGNVEVACGDISVNAAGDGIKSTKNAVVISDGKVSVKAGKDAIQGETAVTISGGDIVASGDRGFAGETINLTITGGRVFATATEGLVVTQLDIPSSVFYALFGEVHAKSDVLTIGGIEFTANKKYQYVLAYDPSFGEKKPAGALVNGEEYDFSKVLVSVDTPADAGGFKPLGSFTESK